jgi:hypothetical protein
MKRQAAFLPLAAFIIFAAAQACASTPTANSLGPKTSDPAPRTQSVKPTPDNASDLAPSKPTQLFTVNDEKGLVLTCIAPEIESNADTDVFKSCSLAAGRTLDDVMHTFVKGIHYEQSQHQKERDAWMKYLEEQAAQKPAQKP